MPVLSGPTLAARENRHSESVDDLTGTLQILYPSHDDPGPFWHWSTVARPRANVFPKFGGPNHSRRPESATGRDSDSLAAAGLRGPARDGTIAGMMTCMRRASEVRTETMTGTRRDSEGRTASGSMHNDWHSARFRRVHHDWPHSGITERDSDSEG